MPPSFHSYASYLVWKDLGGGFTRPLALPLGLYVVQLSISWTVLILFFAAHAFGLVRCTVSSSRSSVGADQTARPPEADNTADQSGAGQ